MRVTSSPRQMRLLSAVITGCLLLTLAGAMTAPRPGAARSAAPVDLAALLPGILDLENAGLDGLVPSSVNDADTIEQYLSFETFPDENAYQDRYDALDAAGFVRNFQTWWTDEAAIRANAAGDGFAPETQARFYATQFADDAGAASAFTALEAGDDDLDATGIDLGDATDVSDATATVDGHAYDGIDVTVRIGALTVGVMVRTQAASPAHGHELDLATELIGAFVDRIEAFNQGGLPTDTVGLDPVRFIGASLYTGVDGYLVRDGETVWAYTGQPATNREGATASQVDVGVTSQYEIRQILVTEELAGAPFGYIIDSLVTQYGSEGEARDAFAGTLGDWRALDYSVTELDDAPTVGDESIAFRAADASGKDFVSVMTWRDGATIHRAYINHPRRFAEPAALFALVDAQRTCLDDGSCWRNRPLPDEIGVDAGPAIGDASAGTPAANGDGTPVAAGEATPTPAGVASPVPGDRRGSYRSDDHGFSLAWDDAVWTRTGDYQPFFGVEGLQLIHVDGGTLFIEVQDSPATRTVAGCVENLSEVVLSEEGVEDIEPAPGGDGDVIAGESDGLAYAAYAITFGGDDGLDYFACATLEEGESAVGFVYVTSELDTVESQLADVEAVIASYDAG